MVRKNWFCQRHSLFCRKSLASFMLTGALMHWILFWVLHWQKPESDVDALILTWAWCWLLLSDKTLPIWQVGFLPYFPYPVTMYDTVFTALYNLANVANQLQQYCLPVFCDEGVYCTITKIFLKQPEHFWNLVPMMGGFHMTRAAMHCVGKYLR